MIEKFGFLILAFGKARYIDQAVDLAISLKRHMPHYPVALVTDGTSLPPGLFDHVVPIDRNKGGGFIQKVWLDAYSPFEKTMFIDSDCIVGRPFEDHLAALQAYSFTPVCERYLKAGDRDEDGWVKDIGLALAAVNGSLYPKFNGGIYYFDRSEKSQAVFEKARALLKDVGSLGLQNPSGGEVGDETLFALALSALGLTDLYDDKGTLMRTPIGINGPFEMSADFSNFRFKKYGQVVAPAICHFAGANVLSWPYLKVATYGRNGALSAFDRGRLAIHYARHGWPHYLRAAKRALGR
ncbi:hypothetical protein BJF93_03540 [Xaviernesmea oryzae]|uniref:Uncharacterized protein n=1 Tax=Xaviernesmea oryzae TaxID=464029 RepID=A0A1Q9AUD4_9HYPH|nr:hypothetical protein [Xaviernesmea oryzae]OLP59014.1 hypothetical protein BJF93_03540 [Xaviernesmea oryzae]SEK90569.1 hypothetical protein SAMN04487976_104337 [Xaviernesmea oryzae]